MIHIIELNDFEDYVLEWCNRKRYFLKEVIFVQDKSNRVEIRMYKEVIGEYGIKKHYGECYQCYLNDDMTFKNVPHGLVSKVRGKKLKV